MTEGERERNFKFWTVDYLVEKRVERKVDKYLILFKMSKDKLIGQIFKGRVVKISIVVWRTIAVWLALLFMFNEVVYCD